MEFTRFLPVLSRRSPSDSHFAELFLSPGPEAIGVTGDNSYQTMYGYDWLLVWDRDDGMLHLWQERGGVWHEVVDDLPPVFASPAPVGSRRWSLAFDQAARVVLAYEDDTGVIRVTRWDAALNQYVQNVSFTGHDPCVVIDASWSLEIPGSDVLAFYLSADRQRVLCRVQRDIYAVEREIWDYGQPVILDRAVAAPLRYQVLVSDENGVPLSESLISALYPYLAYDELVASATGPLAGDYVQVILYNELAESITAYASGPAGGLYADPVITYGLTGDMLEGQASGPTGGAYADVVIRHALSGEGIEGTASGLTTGTYKLAVIETSLTGEGINATASGPAGGNYV